MDRDGNGRLSTEEPCAAVEDFSTKTDENLPGALVLDYGR